MAEVYPVPPAPKKGRNWRLIGGIALGVVVLMCACLIPITRSGMRINASRTATAEAVALANAPTATTMPTVPPTAEPTATLPPEPTATASPTATAAPTDTPEPTAPPTQTRVPTFNSCQADPSASSAPNFPVRIVSVNKSAETVTLSNVSGAAVNLDGWHLCSIEGNQEQRGVGGTLGPGETRVFGNPGGAIWNNSKRDDAALYDVQGRLVSYREDR